MLHKKGNLLGILPDLKHKELFYLVCGLMGVGPAFRLFLLVLIGGRVLLLR